MARQRVRMEKMMIVCDGRKSKIKRRVFHCVHWEQIGALGIDDERRVWPCIR